MPTARRITRIAGIALAAVLLVFAAAAAAGYLWLNSASGHRWLVRTAESAASESGFQIEIEKIEGDLPFSASFARAQIADPEGNWLVVENARVAWRPMALLDGELVIVGITAEAVALDRLPKTGDTARPTTATADQASELIPSFKTPLPIRVDELRVDKLSLGPQVLGEAASFRLNGSLAAEAEAGLRSVLSVERTDDAPATRLQGEAVLHGKERTLNLNLEITEDEGGLLSTLADLPGRPALRFSLVGDGPLEIWRGQADFNVAEAEGRFQIQLDEARRLRLDGSVTPGPFVPEELQPLTLGGLKVSLDADRQTAEKLRLSVFHLESQSAALSAKGQLDLETGQISADGELGLTDDDALHRLIAPTKLTSLKLAASLAGSIASPRATLSATATAVTLPELGFRDVELQMEAQSEHGLAGFGRSTQFSLQASAAEMDGADSLADGLGALLRGPLRLETAGSLHEGETLDLTRLQLYLPEAQVDGTARAALSQQTAEADLSITLGELAALERLTSLPLRGRATLQARLNLPAFDGRLQTDFEGTVQAFRFGEDIVDALIGETADLSGEMTLAASGALDFPRLRITSERATADAVIAFPADFVTFSVDTQARIPDASVLNNAIGIEMQGPITADARVFGPVSDPSVEGTAGIERLKLAGENLESIEAQVRLDKLASGATGRVSARAASPYGLAQASTRMRLGENSIEFSEIDANLSGLRARGTARVPYTGTPVAGQFKLSADSLAQLAAQAGLEADAKADIDVQLSGQNATQSLRATGRISSLAMTLGGNALSAERLRVDLRADDLLAEPRFQASVDAANTALPDNGIMLESLALSADGDPRAATFDFAAKGDARGPLDLSGRGTVTLGDPLRITLAQLSGTLVDRPLSLQQPLEVTSSGKALSVRGLDLVFAGGGLSGSFEQDRTGIEAELAIDAMPLSLIALLEPSMEMAGNVSGNLALRTENNAPRGDLDLRFEGLKIEAAGRAKPVNIKLTGQLASGTLSLESVAEGPWNTPLRADAELPVVIDFAGGRFTMPGDQRITGAIDWKGDIEPLFVLLPQDQHMLEGTGEVALRVTGTLDDPQIGGSVSLRNGRYEHLMVGTLLQDLTVVLQAENRTIRITQLKARDGNGGIVTGDGQLEVGLDENFRLNVKAELDKARLVQRDEVTATASGKIGVKGDMTGLEVKGRITVDEAEARLVSNLPPDVVELNVVETRNGIVVDKPDESSEEAGQAALPIALDIQIDMPQKVFIRGRGLDSEWRGNIHVGGTAANPIIEGQLNSVRGQMNLLGKTFTLNPSAVNFLRGPSIDPELDISATHDGDELDVTVRLGGSATNPQLSLSSSPAVPEDEILSRTLFDKPASELTAFETVQLASAIGQLAGGGGVGILDMARNLVGVDVLRVGSSDAADGAATLEAGKYITEDVYLGVEQGAASESGAVSVEVDVTPNIKLKSDVGSADSSNVGVQFQWDY